MKEYIEITRGLNVKTLPLKIRNEVNGDTRHRFGYPRKGSHTHTWTLSTGSGCKVGLLDPLNHQIQYPRP